ncbi:MAG: hypothetical protein H7A25_10325 [Leptospiraceae bacterium]|nr:hypothetical protein [Leptospiraceae bacterium]
MIRFYLLLLLPLALFSYPDRDVRGNYSENFLHLQAKANIQMSDRFYREGDEVYIDFTIRNYGKEPLRIYPSLGELQTYQFIIKDENDELISPRDGLSLEKKVEVVSYSPERASTQFHGEKYTLVPSRNSQKILDRVQERRNRPENLVGDRVKEILIHPGESFTRRLNLSNYYDFETGKKYYVRGFFYPNYTEDRNSLLKSDNQSYFTVFPNKKEKSEKPFYTTSQNAEELSPEEIIYLFLGAELKGNWTYYFKYIHFSEFIMSYTGFAGEYSKAESYNRPAIVDEFKRYLSESRNGKLKHYQVQKVRYLSSNLSRVVVYVERSVNRVIKKFEYVYTLRKVDSSPRGLWKITNLSAKVKK